MRLESKAEEPLLRIVISPSELASEPTSLVRGRVIDVLFLTNVLFRQVETTRRTVILILSFLGKRDGVADIPK